MALIRLCRPQMEKDKTSLLERIRRIEKQLEEGITVPVRPEKETLPAPEQEPETGSGRVQAERPPAPKAAPSDLVEIKKQWKSIVSGLKDARARSQFSLVELMFEPEGEDKALVIVFPDFMGNRYLSDRETIAQLEALIEGRTGKRVELKFTFKEDVGALKEKVSPITAVDDVLNALPGMELVVTDEDEDE